MGDVFDDRFNARNREEESSRLVRVAVDIDVRTIDGSPIADQHGVVELVEDGRVTKRLRAEIAWGQGADGGRYPYVRFVVQFTQT